MIRFVTFVFAVLTATSLMAQSSLKVMTYNIQGLKPGTNPETRLIQIIANLETLDPDIIGLQEINEHLNGQNNQAVRIADSLSAHFGIPYHVYQQSTHLSWDNQYRESIGIITKYPVEQQGYFQLITGTFPRKVVWNRINTPVGAVNFFTTHLDHLSQNVRIQQVRQIKTYIAQQTSLYPGQATILSGDFNDTPLTPTIQLLTNTGTDTFYVETYFVANPGSAGFTVPANAPTSKIDYLFQVNTGQLSIESSEIVMAAPYDGVHFCSDHLGIMTIFSSEVGLDEAPDWGLLDGRFSLQGNYPNPFTSATTIQFGGGPQQAGTVQAAPQLAALKIFDINGRLIKTLVDGELEPGLHAITWDGTNDDREPVGSGVYLYRLESGDVNETKRMILLR